LRLKNQTEIDVEARSLPVVRDGFADEIERNVAAAHLMSKNPKRAQGIGMMRIDLQNLPIELFRFGQTPGLVIPKCGSEHLLQTRR
jgi:hypothetical protein